MSTRIEPYLTFGGRCEEALEFYTRALGAKVEMAMRFSESPEPMPEGMVPPGFENKIMHASVMIGETRVMASDGCGEGTEYAGFSLSISVATEADADAAFNALSDGGTVTMPMEKTFWSPKFGMLTDRFGVSWMVSVASDQPC
ncbi:MAG: VOC family protein [Phycisphaerales bacterium JB054]